MLLILVLLVNYTPVQNFAARKVSENLSQKLKTKVEIAHVRIDFLNHILLQGMYVADQAHDTLLYAGEVQVRITDWFMFKDKPVLNYLSLENTYVHLYRTPTSKNWNYAFIEDAFSTNDTTDKPDAEGKPFEFDLEKVLLKNVRFHFDDKWVGEDLDFDVGDLVLNARNLDFKKKLLDVKNIDIRGAVITVKDYKGGRPAWMRPHYVDTFDFAPFNPDKWALNVGDLRLHGCTFHLVMNDKVPEPNVFDENHLDITGINIATNSVTIRGDTIHGNVENLTAQERCGIAIKTMQSKVTVSPVASICEKLYLETNYSKIRDYYAMRYKHFPNFTEYIDSVVMEGHMKDAIVDKRDIEYFAPLLRDYPQVVATVSGRGKGTVSNLAAHNLQVSDGNIVFKGDVTMKGLPDIYTTYITVSNADVLTTGPAIMHYAPALRTDSNINVGAITYAYFSGKYEGYIEKFSISGLLKTNLGTITSDMQMNMPGFKLNNVEYSGSVAADHFMLGKFFRLPLVGDISFNERVAGRSFRLDTMQFNVDGTVKQIELNGYNYHNILTQGTIAKKRFDGKLLVDDPNLALEFDGGLDYSQALVKINATAHLLGSNLKALKLTGDSVTASADFDLNCTGSNIDNFFGYAKLFNIDMKRNANRLDVDSIYINSSGDSSRRSLTVQSNDFAAAIRGSYQLSTLPASFQYYLARYLPNYIPIPTGDAPDQNLEFSITTNGIDSILAVTYPLIRGFNHSVINGTLNTSAHKLAFNASVPQGSIGRFQLNNVSVNSIGNLNQIAVNTTIDNVILGDSVLNSSLSLTSTIGNDSVSYTIATTSPDTATAITLNGHALAHKDSLFFTILPSEFYLNRVKWDIAGGSNIVYSDKYLYVQGLSLTSGIQKINAATQLRDNDKTLVVTTEEVDLGQLGIWAGLASYQPDGRLNGTVVIEKIFSDLHVAANVRATGVKLGTDTIGNINIIGDYFGNRRLVRFDPQTGIYRGDASITAAGTISFDSSTNQKLDGRLQFNNTPVAWSSPFLAGIMSHLSGNVVGLVEFSGTAFEPQIKGDLLLMDAGFKLDYMGCSYTVPSSRVRIDNKRITFAKTEIHDVYKNTAVLTGYFSHDLFKDMRMRLNVRSDKFEVMNLSPGDNSMFYGNVIAGVDSFTIRGPFNNVRLNVYNAVAAARSRIYIPVVTGGDLGTYSYVSFTSYGKDQDKAKAGSKDKLHVVIDANLTPLAEMHIVLDPTAGDEIFAKGSGNIQLDVPPDNDMHITGVYSIDEGIYKFTFKQLFIDREFRLQPGSTINFNGPFSETSLNVDAVYSARARLYDLLNESDKVYVQGSDLVDAQSPQMVDVLLHMNGSLVSPRLTFDLDLANKHSQSSLAYRKLMLINGDDRQKFDQVASLLLIGAFIPPEGLGGGSVLSGGINNISQIVSSTASTGLTNIVNKILGDRQLNVLVKYTNYNYNNQGSPGGVNRNQVKLGLNKNYFNNRLLVEVGSTSDWGRPTSASSTSNFNITGDFRIQYLLSQNSGLRLNAFRTSDYDVTLDRDIVRSGIGIGWRKSFDNFSDFFHGNKYLARQKAEQERLQREADSVLMKGGSN